MKNPAQQQLYMQIGHRRAQAGGKDPLHLFPGSSKLPKTALAVRDTQGNKGKKAKTKKVAKGSGAATVPGPAVIQPNETASVTPAPYQTRSSGSVQPPSPSPSAEPYCRVYLLECLKLRNTKNIPFKCTKGPACVPGRHSSITVDENTSKSDLEAFLTTPESLATWSPPNGPVVKVKSCLDKYVKSL